MGSVGILGTRFTPAFIHFPSIQFLGGAKPRQQNQSHATIRKNLFFCFDVNNEAEESTWYLFLNLSLKSNFSFVVNNEAVEGTWYRYLILYGAGFGKLLIMKLNLYVKTGLHSEPKFIFFLRTVTASIYLYYNSFQSLE